MDSLICQAYYNSALTTVLSQLVIGDSNSKLRKKRPKTIDGDFSGVKTSNLYHVPIPEQFAGKKYSKLFDLFTTRRLMIPLGLYRRQTVNLNAFKEEDKQNPKVPTGSDQSKS